MTVTNCLDCGIVMLERRVQLCNNCIENRKEDLLKIKEYLATQRSANVMEVMQNTGLPLSRIRQLTSSKMHA